MSRMTKHSNKRRTQEIEHAAREAMERESLIIYILEHTRKHTLKELQGKTIEQLRADAAVFAPELARDAARRKIQPTGEFVDFDLR